MTKIESWELDLEERIENRTCRKDTALHIRSKINARRLVTSETTTKEVSDLLSDRRDQTTGVNTDTRIMRSEFTSGNAGPQ